MDASSDWVSNTLFAQDYALDLDGTDDYVLITENSAFKPTSALTLSAWIYINDWSNSDYYTPISITQSGGYSFYLHTDDKLYFYIDAGGSYIYPSKDVSSVSSGWHHVAGTFDGRYAKLYWDGALAETIDNGSTVNINYGTANLIFGAEPTSAATVAAELASAETFGAEPTSAAALSRMFWLWNLFTLSSNARLPSSSKSS